VPPRQGSQSAFAVVVQLQGFIQPVENDLVFVRQGARLAMILGPICGGESDNLLWSLQRIVDLLRLAVEKHIPIDLKSMEPYQHQELEPLRIAINQRNQRKKGWSSFGKRIVGQTNRQR
jgi:hypothetical protein